LHTPELERTVVHNSSWALREGVLLRAHQQSRG
jgi:hypothetical protein